MGASQGRLGRIGMILAPIILIALIIAIRVGGVGSSASPTVVTYPTRTMGTYAGVMLVTADSATTAPQAQAISTQQKQHRLIVLTPSGIGLVAHGRFAVLPRECRPRRYQPVCSLPSPGEVHEGIEVRTAATLHGTHR